VTREVVNEPSLVIKEMNSLTHSCIHSLASWVIIALSRRAFLIILVTAFTDVSLKSFYGLASEKLFVPGRPCVVREDSPRVVLEEHSHNSPLAIGNHLSCSLTPNSGPAAPLDEWGSWLLFIFCSFL